MFQHSTRLPHLSVPGDYFGPERFARERQSLFMEAWHLVGAKSDLSRPGDFLTVNLLGHPIQVRNFNGTLAAHSNVCAHRHCLLTHDAKGHSDRMRCQYHGWEYDEQGRSARIPQPKNFAPFDRQAACLPAYRLESCGQLLFVSLSAAGPSLAEFIGPLYAQCAERFSESWTPYLSWEFDLPVNWKVPIENALEAYHVPCVHPETFREDPGEDRSRHLLDERHTALVTQLPFSTHSRLDAWFQRSEGWLLRRLGLEPTGQYQQHHAFPHLLFSFTDALSLIQTVIPTGPTTSRTVIRQFGRTASGLWKRPLTKAWGKLAAVITRRILEEDLALFPDIQRGLEASPHQGMLGRCEERIYCFQEYLLRAVDKHAETAAAVAPHVEEPALDAAADCCCAPEPIASVCR